MASERTSLPAPLLRLIALWLVVSSGCLPGDQALAATAPAEPPPTDSLPLSADGRDEIKKLRLENRQLAQQLKRAREFQAEYVWLTNSVSDVLREIAEQESLARVATTDLETKAQVSEDNLNQRIGGHLKSIQQLIADSRAKEKKLLELLDRARKEGEASAAFVKGLQVSIHALQSDIHVKESSLTQLHGKVEELRAELLRVEEEKSDVERELKDRVDQTDAQKNTIHWLEGKLQGFFLSASQDEVHRWKKEGLLVERKLLTPGTRIVQHYDANGLFTPVDYRKPELLICDQCRDVAVLSFHAEKTGEYVLRESFGKIWLVINDSEAFWSTSKYLIVTYRNKK